MLIVKKLTKTGNIPLSIKQATIIKQHHSKSTCTRVKCQHRGRLSSTFASFPPRLAASSTSFQPRLASTFTSFQPRIYLRVFPPGLHLLKCLASTSYPSRLRTLPEPFLIPPRPLPPQKLSSTFPHPTSALPSILSQPSGIAEKVRQQKR